MKRLLLLIPLIFILLSGCPRVGVVTPVPTPQADLGKRLDYFVRTPEVKFVDQDGPNIHFDVIARIEIRNPSSVDMYANAECDFTYLNRIQKTKTILSVRLPKKTVTLVKITLPFKNSSMNGYGVRCRVDWI